MASLGASDKRLTALPSPGATLPFLEVFQTDPCPVQLCLAHTTLHAGGTQEIGPSSGLGSSFPCCLQETAPAHSELGRAGWPRWWLSWPNLSLASLQQHHHAAGERISCSNTIARRHLHPQTHQAKIEAGSGAQRGLDGEPPSSPVIAQRLPVRWSAHQYAELPAGPGQVVAGLRRGRVKKHQLLNPRVWHCVHLAAGWWGWCGWVCVFCLVLFLLAMCHFGGGETFNNAPSRSSRSVFHS